MKKRRPKTFQYDPEVAYLVKHVWPKDDGRMKKATWLSQWPRINNRKRHHTYKDALAAGYFMAELNSTEWQAVHAWCKAQFGSDNYVWFGHRFFFKTEAAQKLFLENWGES